MIAKVVLLNLTVYNCDTGAVLYESAREMPAFSVSGDRLDDCRQDGISQADGLTARYRKAAAPIQTIQPNSRALSVAACQA